MINSGMNNIILTVATITLTMTRLNSLLEMDMKKLVALSTLSQNRIIFISISTNLYSIQRNKKGWNKGEVKGKRGLGFFVLQSQMRTPKIFFIVYITRIFS